MSPRLSVGRRESTHGVCFKNADQLVVMDTSVVLLLGFPPTACPLVRPLGNEERSAQRDKYRRVQQWPFLA